MASQQAVIAPFTWDGFSVTRLDAGASQMVGGGNDLLVGTTPLAVMTEARHHVTLTVSAGVSLRRR